MSKKRKAFTLTELLVVVVIIGVLSAVILPQFSKVIETRKMTEAEEMMAAVRNEQEARCSISKSYTADFNKLASLNKQADTKNYKYEDLEGVGVQAAAKGSYTYSLQMPSYIDGRICCEGEDCQRLNKNYPSCADLKAKGDYVPGNAECEADPLPNPVPESKCTEGATQGSQKCNGCGTQTTQICQGGNWVDQLGACNKTAEECQPTTDRRLCGGGTEQNPDEGDINWNGQIWNGVECRTGRAIPPPDKYDVPIPNDATEAEIQELCCGGEGSCGEGEWLTAEDTCCPIGQVGDGKGGCTECDPTKNEISDDASRTCVPKFRPTYHDGFGIISDDNKVHGPYFTIAGPQCGRSVVGMENTPTRVCTYNDVTWQKGGKNGNESFYYIIGGGDLCSQCDARKDWCEISCYVREDAMKAAQKLEARPRIAGFDGNFQQTYTEGECAVSMGFISNNPNLPKKYSRYRIDGWTDVSAQNVMRSYTSAGPSRPIANFCATDAPIDCSYGIDPLVGIQEAMRDELSLLLEQERLRAMEIEEALKLWNQQQNKPTQQDQQGGDYYQVPIGGSGNNNGNTNNQPVTWQHYASGAQYSNDPNYQAGSAFLWNSDEGAEYLTKTDGKGGWVTTDIYGNVVDIEPDLDTVITVVPTEANPQVQALYDQLEPGQYGWGRTSEGLIYVVQRGEENVAGTNFEYKITYYNSIDDFNTHEWNGKYFYDSRTRTVTTYRVDAEGNMTTTTEKTNVKTWPPMVFRELNEGNNMGTLEVGAGTKPSGVAMDQMSMFYYGNQPLSGDISNVHVDVPSNTNTNDPGPGSGSYWMYHMWNDGIQYVSDVSTGGEGAISPDAFAGPYCYDCVGDNFKRDIIGGAQYLDANGNPSPRCDGSGGCGVTMCLAPVYEKVAGYVCTPWGAR